ncbi:hypothetical protein FHS85_004004 [Rhodoligotrophos appendicifer]|uniref:hypothetical protein n=1 Tax=Rhodoligotrophos appendicifer TaxID=987056 RepID=UPI001186CA14|nr:hypothetical protein [Rhodoligotrophos appendicifer]
MSIKSFAQKNAFSILNLVAMVPIVGFATASYFKKSEPVVVFAEPAQSELSAADNSHDGTWVPQTDHVMG